MRLIAGARSDDSLPHGKSFSLAGPKLRIRNLCSARFPDTFRRVCGSFSDQPLHSRGSIRAFTSTGSSPARLYTHRGGKWSTFYSEAARGEQLAFFRSVLDGDDKPSRSVRLEVREDRTTVAAVREEAEWPLARTKWTPLYLAEAGTLATDPPPASGSVAFKTHSRATVFSWTVPEDIELTGADGSAPVGRRPAHRRPEPVRRRREVARRALCGVRGRLRLRA